MRVAELIIASCILAVSGAGVASAQFVDPLRVLEESRRDRLEMDKRVAREAAVQRQKEKAAQAAQAKAQLKLDQERAASANSAPAGNTPSPQLEALSAHKIDPGTPTPAVSSASAASGTPGSNPPVAPSSRGETALSAGPASSAKTENPATNQPVAPPAQEAVAAAPAPTPPRVLITVDKAAQRMQVTVDGKLRHSWAVSTGRAHYETPAGTFRPLRLAKVHYSREWDDAPMPHSIFFTDRGHAIHGSSATRSLGRRASHGCVRLAPSKAATLFALVQAEGPGTTKVTITNGTSAGKAVRSRAVEARARKRAHVRRASSDSWQIGPRVGWTE
jgi:lipoprotein-anchoring transpeptidase ErfK/SrfK